MRMIAFVLLASLAGCKSEPAAPARGSAGSGSSASVAAAPEPAAPKVYLPPKLAAKQGVIFAAARGAAVEAKGNDGAAIKLDDGARVDVAEENEAIMGDAGESTIEIASGGKRMTLPLARVLSEERLARSSDGNYAVFSVIETCGDLCHTVLHVVAADGRRAKLGDGVVDRVVAWRNDGDELAVGSSHLWLVSLPDLKVQTFDKYTAPAYAPDGTLYVRDHDGSAYTLIAGKAKRVYKAPPPPPHAEDDYGAEDPVPVAFDAAGKPKYK